MPQKILAEDWSELDDPKKNMGTHAILTALKKWEVDYLVLKITRVYLLYSESATRIEMANCHRNLPVPYPRN